MKKGWKLFLGCIISTIFILSFVSAQSTNPWSASIVGIEKNIFKSSDSIYIRSGKLCEPASEIDLYIVEDNNNWSEGYVLEDVRGVAESVILINSAIPLSKIWENPDSGQYDLVADCNKNGNYDEFVDKIDSFSGPGFEVEADYEKRIKDLEDNSSSINQRVNFLESWKTTLNNSILTIQKSINSILLTLTNYAVRIDALERKTLENNTIIINNTYFFNSTVIINSTNPYLKYQNLNDRKRMICGYGEEKHLTHVEDLGLNCIITYRVYKSAERATCKCQES